MLVLGRIVSEVHREESDSAMNVYLVRMGYH